MGISPLDTITETIKRTEAQEKLDYILALLKIHPEDELIRKISTELVEYKRMISAKEIIQHVNVLDKGYVRLVDYLGTDVTPVNAARASFGKSTSLLPDGTLKTADRRLLEFLVFNDHMSVFRHQFVSFEIRAPLMVCRQIFKYVIGSNHSSDIGWNELSRRYVTEEPEFYIPSAGNWRSAPENKKQGSGSNLPVSTGTYFTERLGESISRGLSDYNEALNRGVAPEQARLLLPAYAMYTTWYWSASLQSIAHFLKQRLAEESQFEIREYANAIKEIVLPLFPISLENLLK